MTRRGLLVVGLLAACKSGDRTPESRPEPAQRSTTAIAEPSVGQPVPAGPAVVPRVQIQFALYHLPAPAVPPRPELERLVAQRAPYLKVVDLATAPKGLTPVAVVSEPSLDGFAPPTVRSLEYSGRGLDGAQAEAVQGSKHALLVEFVADGDRIHQVHRDAMAIMLELAKRTRALLWDESTRELFSSAAWAERAATWTGAVPDAPKLFTIHSYKDGDLVRIVTLGLDKLGLPELVVDDVSPSTADDMASLVNRVAQALADGQAVRDGGLLDVVSKDEGAEPGRVTLKLAVGTREEGDNEGRLWEIVFPGGPANELQARQVAVLDALFGTVDEVQYFKPSEELEKAKRHAREILLREKKPRWRRGWPEMERLMVKAPFETSDGGTEWMWIDVVGWKGSTIEGILQNDPVDVPDLVAGARVTAEESSIFDYIHVRRDGTREGNETSKFTTRETDGE